MCHPYLSLYAHRAIQVYRAYIYQGLTRAHRPMDPKEPCKRLEPYRITKGAILRPQCAMCWGSPESVKAQNEALPCMTPNTDSGVAARFHESASTINIWPCLLSSIIFGEEAHHIVLPCRHRGFSYSTPGVSNCMDGGVMRSGGYIGICLINPLEKE